MQECKKRCNDHGDCVAYVWLYKKCSLLKTITGKVANAAAASGTKGCVKKPSKYGSNQGVLNLIDII